MAAAGAIKHSLMACKIHVYRRENSGQWQCSTYLAGKNHRVSTKTDSLAHAKQFAEDWRLTLRGKAARGEVKTEKTFKEAAATFEGEGLRPITWVTIQDVQPGALVLRGQPALRRGRDDHQRSRRVPSKAPARPEPRIPKVYQVARKTAAFSVQ